MIAFSKQIAARNSPEKSRYKALWLDNRIDDLIAVVDGLGDRFDLTCVKTANEASKAIKKNPYDLYLLDFLLEGEATRSISTAQEILSRNKKAKIIFVSGYLSLSEFRSTIEKIQIDCPSASIFPIDKSDLPVPEDPAFPKFVHEMVELCESRNRSDTSQGWESLEVSEKGRLHFPDYKDFEGLSRPEQEQFVNAMLDRHKGKIKDYFDRGDIWVLFCGSWDSPIASAKKFDEIWSDERAMKYGEDIGYAPIAFSNIETVDDVSSESCSKLRGIDGYPIVKIEHSVPRPGNSGPFYVHFDTGNPVSMICDKTFTNVGWLREKQMAYHVANIGGMKLHVRKFEIPATQATDSRGAVVELTFSGYAVNDWDATRFAVKCAEDCTNGVRHKDGICYFRSGLLGRTFQRECKKWIAFDCARGLIRFIDRG